MRPYHSKLLFFGTAVGLFCSLSGLIVLGLFSPPFVCSPFCYGIPKEPACLIIHRVVVPLFGYTLAGVSLLGLGWGILTIIRTRACLRRSLARLSTTPLSDAFPGVYLVLAGSLAAAFSVGALRPKVFITRALWDQLDPQERQGLLKHEAQHVKAKDGLVLASLEFIARAFFFIPLFSWLKDGFKAAMELTADDAALKSGIRKETLASALIKVARVSSLRTCPGLNLSPTFEHSIETRLQRLLGLAQAPYPNRFRSFLLPSLPGICWVVLPALVSAFHCPSCIF